MLLNKLAKIPKSAHKVEKAAEMKHQTVLAEAVSQPTEKPKFDIGVSFRSAIKSAIAREIGAALPVLSRLTSATPLFPFLIRPLRIVVVPLLLRIATSGTLMTTIPRSRGPREIRVGLTRFR